MVEGERLESVYTATYRGFESLSLRQKRTCSCRIRTLDNQISGSTSREAAQNAAAGSGPEGARAQGPGNPSFRQITSKKNRIYKKELLR